MIFIALNIFFGSAFVLILKWVQLRKQDDVVVAGAINYIFAALMVLPLYVSQWQFSADQDLMNWLTDWSPSFTWAMITGFVMGFIYFVAYFFVIRAVLWVGASSTSVVGVLSILMPIAVGLAVWGEAPAGKQWIGMSLAFVALLLIGWRRSGGSHAERPWFTPYLLFGFFLLSGLSRVSQDTFKHLSDPHWRSAYLSIAFLVTAIPSIYLLVCGRRWPTAVEWWAGIAMGVANVLQTQFLLQALERYEGFVVFPISSAGGLTFTTLVATGLLRERIDRWAVLGILLAIAAVFLL